MRLLVLTCKLYRFIFVQEIEGKKGVLLCVLVFLNNLRFDDLLILYHDLFNFLVLVPKADLIFHHCFFWYIVVNQG